MRRSLALALFLTLAATMLVPSMGAMAASRKATTHPVFSDDFESGGLANWTKVRGVVAQGAIVYSGAWAAEAKASGAPTYLLKSLGSTYTDLTYKARVRLNGASTTANLLRFRTASAWNVLTLYRSASGNLFLRNDVSGASVSSPAAVSLHAWHLLSVHVIMDGATSHVDVSFDEAPVADLSGTQSLGASPIGQLILGDDVKGRTFDAFFDNVLAFVTTDTSSPTPPGTLTAVATSPKEADLTWRASTDDVGVTGYDVYRNSSLIASVGETQTTYADKAVAPSTAYAYVVRAKDAAGHTSDPSNQANVTTPDPRTGVVASNLHTWQTNGIVWALAYANGVVYAGGDFTSVRPPGAAPGTGEVPRTHIAAFDAVTGDVLPFSHDVDNVVYALATSPDGSRVYAGGDFRDVDGSAHHHLAAFDTSNGSLDAGWVPSTDARVGAIDAFGSVVYVSGSFTTLDDQSRQHLGAVTAADSTSGVPLPWAPTTDDSVDALAVTPDGSTVAVGGYFNTLNGDPVHAIGWVDATTGATQAWSAITLPSCTVIKALTADAATNAIYAAPEGTGAGCFEGIFSVDASTGALNWANHCFGATQAVAVIADNVYDGSHAHNCGSEPGGFPQVEPRSHSYHLMRLSIADGNNSTRSWFPWTNGVQLGPRAMATDGVRLFVGGDFTYVNHKPQQGFVIFPPGPDATRPSRPAPPTVASTASGVASVSWPASVDLDNGDLTYGLYRDGGTTPIAYLATHSTPWATPMLRYRDAGLAPGSDHTYRVQAADGVTMSPMSTASAAVSIAGTDPAQSCPNTVLADHPSLYWRLGESSGTIAEDATGHGLTGTYFPGVTQGASGAIPNASNTAAAFPGTPGAIIRSTNNFSAPTTFSLELWFKTTTLDGGKLVGFGNSSTEDNSTSYDRQIFMTADGHLNFSTKLANPVIVTSPRSYNDGAWHHVVATFGPGGLAIYVDGTLVGASANTKAASYKNGGYWRLGGDNLHGWQNYDTAPPSYYWAGSIDEFAVYGAPLSDSQVAAHYAANLLNH